MLAQVTVGVMWPVLDSNQGQRHCTYGAVMLPIPAEKHFITAGLTVAHQPASALGAEPAAMQRPSKAACIVFPAEQAVRVMQHS